MKTILVPTDFSPAADLALEFAARIASTQHARLVLLHVFLSPLPISEVSREFWLQEVKMIKENAGRRMKESWEKVEKIAGNIPHQTIIVEGDPVTVILEKIKKTEPELIVMGTKGSQGLSTVIFGSTTAAVLKESECPVLAVPASAKPVPLFRKFTFATDYQSTDISAITDLITLAKTYKAQVNILHVSPENTDPEEDVKLMNRFRNLVTDTTDYNQLSFQIISGDTKEELLRYMNEERTDIIVFSTLDRGFFENIFHASLTKKIVLNAPIPVLAFHTRKEKKTRPFLSLTDDQVI